MGHPLVMGRRDVRVDRPAAARARRPRADPPARLARAGVATAAASSTRRSTSRAARRGVRRRWRRGLRGGDAVRGLHHRTVDRPEGVTFPDVDWTSGETRAASSATASPGRLRPGVERRRSSPEILRQCCNARAAPAIDRCEALRPDPRATSADPLVRALTVIGAAGARTRDGAQRVGSARALTCPMPEPPVRSRPHRDGHAVARRRRGRPRRRRSARHPPRRPRARRPRAQRHDRGVADDARRREGRAAARRRRGGRRPRRRRRRRGLATTPRTRSDGRAGRRRPARTGCSS